MYSTTTLLLALAGSAPDKPQTHYNTEPPPYDDAVDDDATVSSPNQQRATRLKEHNRNFTSIIIHLSLCTVAFLLHSSAADHSRDDDIISYHQSSPVTSVAVSLLAKIIINSRAALLQLWINNNRKTGIKSLVIIIICWTVQPHPTGLQIVVSCRCWWSSSSSS